jgi:hypothetical protein
MIVNKDKLRRSTPQRRNDDLPRIDRRTVHRPNELKLIENDGILGVKVEDAKPLSG